MKAKIIRVDFHQEYESKFGTLYSHKVEYLDKVAFYSSKKKEQTYFKPGEEAEFIEEIKVTKRGEMIIIKPQRQGKFSGYHKDLKREQSKYSGFAMSYAKDLVIAGKLEFKEMLPACKKMFDYMVKLDNEMNQTNKEEQK